MDNVKTLICPQCGAEVSLFNNTFECNCCGLHFKIDAADPDNELFKKASIYRTQFNFQKAIDLYDEYLERHPGSFIANYAAILAEYGIQFTPDFDDVYNPTFCHRASETSMMSCKFYNLLNAEFKAKVKELDRLRETVLIQASNIKENDVFICCLRQKSIRDDTPTSESFWAKSLRNALRNDLDLSVFYTEDVTKNNDASIEPHIYSAITSCRMMVLLGSSVDNINDTWVRNDWLRFLKEVEKDPSKKSMVAVFKNISSINMPPELYNVQVIHEESSTWLQDTIDIVARTLGVSHKYAQHEYDESAEKRAKEANKQPPKKILTPQEQEAIARDRLDDQKYKDFLNERANREVVLKKKKRAKRFGVIATLSLVAAGIITSVFTVIIPNSEYTKAVSCMNNRNYEEAITYYRRAGNYSNAKQMINVCKSYMAFDNNNVQDGITYLVEINGKVNLTYDALNGIVSQTSQIINEKTFSLLTATSNESEQLFNKWNIDNYSISYSKNDYSCDLTLKANYIYRSYNITYDLNGGTINTETLKDTYTYADIVNVTNPTRTGYDFVGWSYDGKAPNTSLKLENEKGDKTIKANWKAKDFTLSFNSDGGNSISDITVTYDEIYTLPIPTKSGQVFYGWYDDNDNLIENGTWTGLEDLTLKAKWTTFNEYTNNGYTYIEYGKYPQKVVEDQDIISYISSNECTDKEGYLAYNGKQYARVNSAHPKGNYTSNSGNVTFEDGKTYYFEVEPITWRILENNSGKRLLFADKVLDVHNFDNDKRITNGIYPNNYKESSIREWLINTFYNKAFIGGDKQNIKATNVDNSTATVKNGGTNDYTCDNTNDKIFLLSYQDLINTTYGFSNDDSSNDDLLRTGYATDYALATGVCLNPDDNSSYYWTRSSDGASQNFNALPVVYYGILNRPLDVTTAHVGVRPAITIEF